MALTAFHDRSLGTLPPGDNNTSTAEATMITSDGGLGKDFISVKLVLSSVSKAF